MENPNSQQPQRPVRRRPKQPKWKRFLHKHLQTICCTAVSLASVVVICFCVAGTVDTLRGPENPSISGTTLPTDNTTGTDPTISTTPTTQTQPTTPTTPTTPTKPTSPTTPTTQTKPTTPTVPTTPTTPTVPKAEIQKMAQDLIKETDFIAAGYDYQKAISLLKAFEYYEDVPELAAKVKEYTDKDSQLVSYSRMHEVTHIFFHSLIVDTARAFDGQYTQDGYNLYMTTVDEFNAMLQQMYDRGFVLVSPYDVAYEITDEKGTRFVYGDIRLPKGKKPFLMSQDDVNYYGYMIGQKDGSNNTPVFAKANGDGFAHKIVIGDDGYPTCEYMDAKGNVLTGDYDLVPLLERFIQAHPDFSYHGARAILGVTGYEGVLGYRTKPAYEAALGSAAYQKEIADAKAVVQCLKDHGWILASHSYGHPAYGEISAARVETDSGKWEDTCQSIIGDTDILLYPHGSDIAGINYYNFNNAKFKALYDDGYRYFFNVDSHVYWAQLGSNYYRGGRRNLDGYRMYHDPEMLDDLFDVKTVFDKKRPTPVPSL